jgi:hypothetical protein
MIKNFHFRLPKWTILSQKKSKVTLPGEQSLISPRGENKALPFLCLISDEHALFPICQNMSKESLVFLGRLLNLANKEAIACSLYSSMLDA